MLQHRYHTAGAASDHSKTLEAAESTPFAPATGLTSFSLLLGRALASDRDSWWQPQEEPYGIWKYWRTDARAVLLCFIAVVSAIQYFSKLSAYDAVRSFTMAQIARCKCKHFAGNQQCFEHTC